MEEKKQQNKTKQEHNFKALLSNLCNTCCGEFLPDKRYEVKASVVALIFQ